jgi:hypothetical protein
MTRPLTFANITSALALTVALGTGTAFAATHLPNNSVTGRTIKNSTVTGKDVKDGSLKAADFAAGQLPAGQAGPPGPAGAAAATVYAAVIDSDATNPATLGVNKGALSVNDPAGANSFLSPYVITFNRSLNGCVANTTIGTTSGGAGTALIGTNFNQVQDNTVIAFSFSQAGAPQDVSFMVAVYC